MKTMKKIIVTACLLSIVVVSAAFVKLQHKKDMNTGSDEAKKGFAVVELFTSEGCSSCPPADELVAEVQKKHPGEQLYILTYHVDYWNNLGWKDKFSDADYSKRQRKYAGWLGPGEIYTPQIIVNGKTEFVGSDRGALQGAITEGLQGAATKTLILKDNVANGRVNIDYQTNSALAQSDLVIALVQKAGQSNVGRGENAGHILTHVQIVRKLAIEPLRKESGQLSIDLPADHNTGEWELIGMVQNRMNGTIVSAARTGVILR
jgi:hypothetical protein